MSDNRGDSFCAVVWLCIKRNVGHIQQGWVSNQVAQFSNQLEVH